MQLLQRATQQTTSSTTNSQISTNEASQFSVLRLLSAIEKWHLGSHDVTLMNLTYLSNVTRCQQTNRIIWEANYNSNIHLPCYNQTLCDTTKAVLMGLNNQCQLQINLSTLEHLEVLLDKIVHCITFTPTAPKHATTILITTMTMMKMMTMYQWTLKIKHKLTAL